LRTLVVVDHASAVSALPTIGARLIQYAIVYGLVEQVRQNLEKANEKVYGKRKVLRLYDGQPAAGNEQEMTACK
jgi:hypothetical protein